MRAASLEIFNATKRFGALVALDNVSLRVEAGTMHALLGENGAGKSTLMKGVVGFYQLDEGSALLDGREIAIDTPRTAAGLGIGMVYQQFTLVPSMTVAENLTLARGALPWHIRWRDEYERLAAFFEQVPFKLDLQRPVHTLAAGEKQKVEILKQLYLERRLLILDEPTSVLTPDEADEVLGLLHTLTRQGLLTVIMITHKFREVMTYADNVTVLRRGKLIGHYAVKDSSPEQLAAQMLGHAPDSGVLDAAATRPAMSEVRLQGEGVLALGDTGLPAVNGVSFSVRGGEILGVAGVSGNGQRELVEVLTGQRPLLGGEVRVNGKAFRPARRALQQERVYSIPEEPLRNGAVAALSVADNMALRDFDLAPLSRWGWLRAGRVHARARDYIARFGVRPADPALAIGTLSGGNVQRAVLARELSRPVNVLIVANPVFGLDFAAVAETHARLRAARDSGAAVLLVSEDLDELLELADRVVVMSAGQLVHETPARDADRRRIGWHMAGGSHGAPAAAAYPVPAQDAALAAQPVALAAEEDAA